MTSQQLMTRLNSVQYLPIDGISERLLYPLQSKELIAIINTFDGLQITKLRK